MKHAFALALLLSMPLASARAERPNIVFMLSDDQGWSGLSVAMRPNVSGSKGDIYQGDAPHSANPDYDPNTPADTKQGQGKKSEKSA